MELQILRIRIHRKTFRTWTLARRIYKNFFQPFISYFLAVLWIRISFNADPDQAFYLGADVDPAFYLNADPGPDSRSLTNADLDPCQSDLKSQKVEVFT
jgi:hypothetical protein